MTYSFGIYSTSWLALIIGDTYPLWVSLGWGTLINFFYLPGSLFGAFLSDWIGPRHCLALGVVLQGIIGFIMTGIYKYLNTPEHVAGFVVMYGIFLAVGEVGPGGKFRTQTRSKHRLVSSDSNVIRGRPCELFARHKSGEQ